MSGLNRGRAQVLVTALWLGAFLLLSCQPAQPVATPKPAEKPAEKPVRGGTLRIAIPSEFGSLDPNTSTAMVGMYSLYEQLIEPDKDGSLIKEGLAKDWSVSSDGKTITFKLREGVKFHDGTNFDAAAVKFNIERMRDPANKSPFRSFYDSVASVEVVDNLTVRFNLSRPDVLILARLAGAAGGLMISPAAVKKYGQDFPRNPVGTGPFQFVEWVAADHVAAKRFEGYWKKDKEGNQLPYLDRVVFQFITDPTTAVANLRTGQIDLIGGAIGGVPAEQQPLVKNDPNLTYQIRGKSNTVGTSMNTKKPPFDNKALRQAVALAVDREGMSRFLGEGAKVYFSIINPTPADQAFDDAKAGVSPPRDVAKAKAKMAEAGYPAGGLKVKNTVTSDTESVRISEILKANLAEIGIELEIETLAKVAFDTKVRTSPWDYQMGNGALASATSLSVGDPGHYLSVMFHSRGSRNWFGPYSNPRFDEPLDKALVTYDQKERAALYQQAARVLVEDVPFLPLYVPNYFGGMNKKVRNYFLFFDVIERPRDVWLAQ